MHQKNKVIELKYYILLSGQDYPLMSVDKINKDLEKQYPKAFIDCTPYSNTNWVHYKFEESKFLREYPYKFNGPIIKFFLLASRKLIMRPLIKKLKKTDIYKLKKYDFKLYGGSAWWILPNVIINYI